MCSGSQLSLGRRSTSIFVAAAAVLSTSAAFADDPPQAPPVETTAPASTPPPTTPTPTTQPPPTTPPPVEPTDDTKGKLDFAPRRVEPPPSRKFRFEADPVGDTGTLVVALTFSILSNEVLSTGEIRPQQISPSFRRSELLGIDRGAISQTTDSNAGTFSNFGLYAAVAYAVIDSGLDIFREGSQAALVDAIMYAEAGTMSAGVTNVAKIAFRRPRPKAYIARQAYLNRGGDPATYDNSDTDSALSFFSGHASVVASLGAAATYIAFARSPSVKSVRPWLTLAGSALLTAFVSYERVRGGDHFPTDVMAGALAGGGIGALVVHLHREDAIRQRPVWIGMAPSPNGGGVLSASGLF